MSMGDSIAAQAIGSGGRREVRQRAEGARRADLLLGCAQAEADHTKPSPPHQQAVSTVGRGGRAASGSVTPGAHGPRPRTGPDLRAPRIR